LNCADCGKEIIDEDSSFCAYCGNPFESKKNKTELLGGAAILIIIAATFTLALGVIGLMNYQATVA
jgi:DNA-directed RNA polymerase subunit RPC12/RpoP